jgi:hypothetical protein
MAKITQEKSGRCLCGKVSYAVAEATVHHHACHCGMCRRWAGGPAFAAAVKGVSWNGEAFIRRYASSEWAERGFCGECGTHLFFYFKPTDNYYITVGSFDDDADFQLVGEIYVDAQPPGYRFADGLERLTGDEFIAKYGVAADNGG